MNFFVSHPEADYLKPVKIHRCLHYGRDVGKVLLAQLIEALPRAGFELPATFPPIWVVRRQHVGQGLPALKYLSRYLYHGVIAEKQIVG